MADDTDRPVDDDIGALGQQEVKVLIREVSHRIRRLQEEREALEEVRDHLVAEERAIAERQRASDELLEQLLEQQQQEGDQLRALEAQIVAVGAEVEGLVRRQQQLGELSRQAAGEIDGAEQRLALLRRELDAVTSTLEEGSDQLARVKERLSLRMGKSTKGEPG